LTPGTDDNLGQGFASGTVAINLDWPGWAGFVNDPKSSKVAGNVGVKVAPKGSSGKRTGWSGFHGFSVTENCPHKEAAASLVWWLTNEDSQKLEAAAGPLPTRTAVWDWDLKQAENDPYKKEVLEAFEEGQRTPSRCRRRRSGSRSQRRLSRTAGRILGDKTSKQALDDARPSHADSRGRGKL
jgi:multiple sugar transport system substrate-binding protein